MLSRIANVAKAMIRGQVTSFGSQGWTIIQGQGPGAYQATGRTARITGFERNPVAHACTRIVTDLVGSVPLEAYTKNAAGEAKALPNTHELAQLLESPGFGVSALRYRKLVIAQFLNYGNAYNAFTRRGIRGTPIALRVVHPEYVQFVYRDTQTAAPVQYDWVDQFGVRQQSAAMDIVHWRDLTLGEDFTFGFPRVVAALLDLQTDDEASQYVRQVLSNHGAPGIAVMLNDDVDAESARIMEERWQEKFVARGGRGRAAFLGGAQKLEKIGFDLKELEFPALRAIAREDICAVFGVDPRMVGIQSAAGKDAGMSGVQFAEARQRLYLQTGAPLMMDLSSELNEMLAPEFGADVYIRHNPDAVAEITENMEQTSARAVKELLAGGISLEEFREITGRESEMTLTDHVFIPTTSTFRQVSEAQADAGKPTPEPADPVKLAATVAAAKQGGLPPGDTPPADAAPRSSLSPALTRVLSRGVVLTAAQRMALWSEFDQRASREESSLRGEALAQFAIERDAVAGAFSAAVRAEDGAEVDPSDVPDDDALLSVLRWIEVYYAGSVTSTAFAAWRERFKRALGPTMEQAAAQLAAQVGVSWDLENPRVQDAIARRVTKLAGEVTSTTREEIRALIATGREAGLGVKTIARMIDDAVFDGRNLTRATLIARTELVGALNEGEYEAAWLSKRDPKVRDTHEGCDEEGAIPLSARFETNGMLYPGDPAGGPEEVCNCRCTLLFSTEDV
jgi:HK97 family phage portal protein